MSTQSTISQKGEWRFVIENSFVRNASLSVEARLLYIILRGYVGPDCEMPFPSLPTLARHLGKHRETVQKYLKELESSGYLQRVKVKKGSKFQSTRYVIIDRSGNLPLRKLPATELSATKSTQFKDIPAAAKERSKESKESKESAATLAATVLSIPDEKHEPTWKPDKRTKKEQLAAIKPKNDYPSERTLNEYVSENELDHLGCSQRMETLYSELCDNKWHRWNGRAWIPIRDWQAFLIGLDAAIARNTPVF
jgi:DNA-binding Lrp family transcriptional regulator